MSVRRTVAAVSVILAVLLVASSPCRAGNKRYMTINAAKVLAERSLLEMVYGLKVRASESVENMIASSFVGTTETKTQGLLKGVMYDEVIYDAEKDVAKVTASVKLTKITNINGETIDLKGKSYSRVAFATSTPAQASPLKALRAAQIDAYKQLAKQLIGFTLESQTKVENYILTSDLIKSKIMATLILAEMNEYGWHSNGDAFVRMSLNLKDFKDIIGQGVSGGASVVKVEGIGAQEDDFSEAKKVQGAAVSGAPYTAAGVRTTAAEPQGAPSGLTVTISADQTLNSTQGTPHALQLCIYQLKEPNGFNQLAGQKEGVQNLLDCTPFDASVAVARRLVVQPGDRLHETGALALGARFVGISAGYFAPGSGKRLFLSPLPLAGSEGGNSLSINLGAGEMLETVVR